MDAPAGHGEHSNMDDFQQIIAPAFYPGKEDWKARPGNRYTAEELGQMEQNWDVTLRDPRRPFCRAVD